MTDRQITHAPGCWGWGPRHYECAVREIELLLTANERLLAENEKLRAEVERLQEIVRPKREDECLTLDHWRMRAYALEENWSRCSHACAVEQDKREQAEARAGRLEEALAELISWVPSTAVYRSLGFDTEALVRALEKARAALAREGER